MNSIHVSRSQRTLLDGSRNEALRRARVFDQLATEQVAVGVGQTSMLYPNLSNTSNVALSMNGVPPSSDITAGVAKLEQDNRVVNGPVDAAGGGIWDSLERGLGEFVLDPVKGTIRWGMMGLMSVYESTAGGSLIRAREQAQQEDRAFGDTLYEQQPFLTRALADVFRDPGYTLSTVWDEATTKDEEQEARLRAGTMQQVANVGSGFFANSTVDPEVETQVQERGAAFAESVQGLPTNERYAAELKESPNIWRESVAGSSYQAALGTPITSQGYADREGVLFSVSNPYAPTGKFLTPWSPGRYATAMMMEPGTDSFAKVSGVLDFGSQLYLDPMNFIGLAWSKSGKIGRTVRAVSDKVSGVSNKIDDLNNPRLFKGLVGNERNPVKAFGGNTLTDDDVLKLGDSYNDLPDVYKQMIDDRVAFDDPNAYLAWRNMRDRLKDVDMDFDDIDQVRILSGLSDDSMDLMDDMKLQVGEQGRDLGPTDVPEQFYNDVYPSRAVTETPERVTIKAGHHMVGDLNITGKSGKWKVDGVGKRFKTLKEAEAAALKKLASSKKKLRPTPEWKAFADEFTDFHMADGTVDDINQIDSTNRMGQTRQHHSATVAANGGNAKVRVYGRTLDLTEDVLPEGVDPGLVDALKRAGLWDESLGFVGFSDEVAADIPEATMRVLAGNQYGKIKVGDDDWIILDEFIGGQRGEPMSRVFFGNGDVPINTQAGMSSAVGLTPNQLNGSIEWLQMMGRYGLDDAGKIDPTKLTREAMNEFRKTNSESIGKARAAAGDSSSFGPTIDGVRPTTDPKVGKLVGKRAQRLIDDFTAMSKEDNASVLIDRALRYFDRARIKVPNKIRSDLIDAAGDRGLVEAVLVEWIGDIGPTMLQGGTRYGRTRVLADLIPAVTAGKKARGARGITGTIMEQPAIARRFAMMIPTKEINLVDDPDGGYVLLNSILPNFNVRRGQGGVTYLNDEGAEIVTRSIEHVMRDIRTLAPGQKTAAYKLMGEYSQILFAQAKNDIGSKVPDMLLKEVTGFFDDVGRMHVYNTERMAMVELGEGMGDMLRMGGAATYMPGVNFTSEAWSGAMHMPNARSVKRVMNYSDRLGAVSNMLVAKQVFKVDATGEWQKLRASNRTLRKQAEAQSYKAQEASDIAISKAEGRLASAKSPEQTAKMEKSLVKLKDRAAKIENRFPDKESALEHIRNNSADIAIVDRAGTLMARSAINKLWKPMVLLRGAWTVRIMIDDQMRVAAEGYDTIFNHPFRFINYALSQPDGMKQAFKNGFIDLNGVRVNLKDVDEVQFGKWYQDAMMQMSDGIFGKGAYGSKFATPIKRGERYYEEGLTNRLAQMGSDPMNNLLIKSEADDPVAEIVEWLLGGRPDLVPFGKSGPAYRDELRHLKGGHPDIAKAIEEGNEEVLSMLVGQYYAEIHHTSGGLVLIDDGMGNWRMYADKETPMTEIDPAVMGTREIATQIDGQTLTPPPIREGETTFIPRVHIKGDEDILDVLRDGKGMLNNSIVRRNGLLSQHGHREFRSLIGAKVTDAPLNRYPSFSYGPDPTRGKYPDGVGETYTRALSNFFDFFMSTPSNVLSRSPVFEQTYWRHIGETIPFMNKDAAAEFLRRADAAGQGRAVKRAMRRTKKWAGDEAGAYGLLTPDSSQDMSRLIESIDEQAKAMGMAQVERTLFDLSSKRNISDSASLIFPFVEAWGEFLTRWSRLMVYGDRNIKNANRFQQTINGLRESNPFDPTGDQGFFHENDFGQEVFSYPSAVTKAGIHVNNALSALPLVGGAFGEHIDPGLADQMEVTAPVSSMNFASSIIPGIGPAVQIGAQVVMNDSPRWDGIKEIISPYGEVTGPMSMLPGWAKRLASAKGNPDPALNAMYASTVQDIIRTMQMNGEFNNATTRAEYNDLVGIAEDRAEALLMVRAAATWTLPASPQYTFQKEDKTGKVWAFTQLGQEYNEILYGEAESNQNTAFQVFHERFGFLPTPFTSSRSYAIKERSPTDEGYRFQRDNERLFNDYDATARFLQPGVGGEDETLNWSRHLELLRQGEKENWTGEQWISRADDMIGDLWWTNALAANEYLRKAGEMEQYNANLGEVESQILETHPYWRQRAAPGERARVDNKQQIAEVQEWMTDTTLRGRPVVEAARDYLEAREKYMAMMEEEGMTLSGTYTSNEWKNVIAMAVRRDLRQLAEKLSKRSPEFDVLWRNVFAREVGQQHDGFEPQTIDFYGEDLFERTMGYSPNEEQQFNSTFAGVSKPTSRTRFVGA